MQKPLTFLASLAVAALISGPLAAQDEPSIHTVVATVDGTEITLGQMIVARAGLPEQYKQLPEDVLFKGILDQLIQQTALAQNFSGEIPARIEFQLSNERSSLIAGQVIEEVMAEPVSEEDLQAAYDADYADAEGEEEFNASHILVETEEEAKAIKTELDAGADFAALAREKSTGPSGPGGGSLGWFVKGAMVPEFEAAVLALLPGAVSDPVQTQFGWHVVKLNETRKQAIPSLDELRDELDLQLRQLRVQDMIESLTEAADVDRSGAEGIDVGMIAKIELLE